MKTFLLLLIATILWANHSIFTPSAHGEEEKPPFDEVFIKLLLLGAPTVETAVASDVTPTTATINAKLVEVGGVTLTYP